MGVLLDTTNCPFHWLGGTLVALNDRLPDSFDRVADCECKSLVGLLQPTRTREQICKATLALQFAPPATADFCAMTRMASSRAGWSGK
jgi:hypothetical protein